MTAEDYNQRNKAEESESQVSKPRQGPPHRQFTPYWWAENYPRPVFFAIGFGTAILAMSMVLAIGGGQSAEPASPTTPVNEKSDNKSDAGSIGRRSVESSNIPRVISESLDRDHLINTQKIELAKGLYLTIGFIVLDPSNPTAQKGSGVIGSVTLENLVATHDYHLSKRTYLKVGRGARLAAILASPDVRPIKGDGKALDFIKFSPVSLLFRLRGEGPITIDVDGTRYTLSDRWRQHLDDFLEETINQMRARGHSKQ